MAKRIAIFDLDYTLTKCGTWGRFIIRGVATRPHLWIPLILSTAISQAGYKLLHWPRITVKSSMLRWSIAGLSRAKIEALAERFAEREVKRGLRLGALRAIEHHRANGDEILIASAGADVVVKAISERLNVKHYVATVMAWTPENRLATFFASPDCYGERKLERVLQYLEDNFSSKRDDMMVFVYSDSYSDLEMLKFANVGVAINPDKRLRKNARVNNIRIEDWME